VLVRLSYDIAGCVGVFKLNEVYAPGLADDDVFHPDRFVDP
jgi:hypothetical protein